MAGLKEIKKRIGSIHSTMQITAAMKMVAAAKLKRAEEAITQLRPYAQKINEILVQSLSQITHPLLAPRGKEKILLLVVASNRGLCGGFNNNVQKEIARFQADYPQAELTAVYFSKKLMELMQKKIQPNAFFSHQAYELFNHFSFAQSKVYSQLILDHFLKGDWDQVFVIHNSFKNVMIQEVKTISFLPLNIQTTAEAPEIDFIFEPTAPVLAAQLLPKLVHLELYKIFLDSLAAEHAARMTAMHKATDNAKDLKKNLTLAYNKARQAAITQEISEIVSGASALK